MNRRDFVAGAVGASLAPALAQGAVTAAPDGGATPAPAAPRPQILELRRYRMRFGPMEQRLPAYHKNVLVPALNRAGVKPVGAFRVSVGLDSPAIYLLLPHPTAESMGTLQARLADD